MSIDRRRHRLFVTRHTEYHLRSDEVVGVRDLKSGIWLRSHAALRLRALRIPQHGQDNTWVGRRLTFWGMNTDVVTTPVVAVKRPAREVIDNYVSLARAGEFSC